MTASGNRLPAKQKETLESPPSITAEQAKKLIEEQKIMPEHKVDSNLPQEFQDYPPLFQLPTIDPKDLTLGDIEYFQKSLDDESCTYRSYTYHPKGMSPVPVIVKTFNGDSSESEYSSRRQEDTTVRILSSNASSYLPIYGKTSSGSVVMGADFKPLNNILFQKIAGDKVEEVELPRVIIARILYDVAKYLKEINSSTSPHTPYMHRDITLGNVLLPANFEQQFTPNYPSLARIGDHGFSSSFISVGTGDYFVGYAPELVVGFPPQLKYGIPKTPVSYDEKLDVWRFGEFAFFLLTRADPAELGDTGVKKILMQGIPEGVYTKSKNDLWHHTLPKDGGPPTAIYKLAMERCLQLDPKKRATTEEVFSVVQSWYKNEMVLEARKFIKLFKDGGNKNIHHLLMGYRYIFSLLDENIPLSPKNSDDKFIGETLVELLYVAQSKHLPNHAEYQLVLGTRSYPEILAKAVECLTPKKVQQSESLSLEDKNRTAIAEDELPLLKSLLLSSYALSYTIGLKHAITDFDNTDKINENLANNAILLNIFKNADEWKILNAFINEKMKLIAKSNLSQPTPTGLLSLLSKFKPVPGEIKEANLNREGLTALVKQKLFCETEANPAARNAHLKLLAKEIQKFGGNDLLNKIVAAKPTTELAALRNEAQALLQVYVGPSEKDPKITTPSKGNKK